MAVAFASRLSLIVFATMAARGIITGADFEGALKTALLTAGGFYGLGWLLGELARRILEECVAAELAAKESGTTKT